jgi:hypothetical protein
MPFSDDNRAKLLTRSKYKEPYGGDSGNGPAAMMKDDGGIIFPYTPIINSSMQVEYSTYNLTHTNYQQQAYSKTNNPQIQLTANFINQTPSETAYCVGVIHFLRVVTKMHWGANDSNAGTPPPVLDFSAYGLYNFNKVPVVVQGFNVMYDDSVDYVPGPDNTQVPAIMTISIDLLPSYSPQKQQQFSLQEFANGNLYSGGFI